MDDFVQWRMPKKSKKPARQVEKTASKPEYGKHYLREWRKHKRLTQEKVAGDIGVDRSLISKIERYKAQYTQFVLQALARTYGCSVYQLLEVSPDKPNALLDALETLQKADAKTQETAVKLIKAITAA